jgi:hypothetical protein
MEHNMGDRIDSAFDRIRKLPPEQQSHVADLLEDVVTDHTAAPPLSTEDERLIDAAIASIDAGRGVSGPDVEAFWNRPKR